MTTFSPVAPVLETPRLRLRGFRASDLDPQWATMTDPEVVRHLGGPASREETWRKILGSPGLWALLGYGYWVAERREDGAYLGQIGFADFKRDRKSTRLNSSHGYISYAVFCLKKKKITTQHYTTTNKHTTT